jgi:hypothetical protein
MWVEGTYYFARPLYHFFYTECPVICDICNNTDLLTVCTCTYYLHISMDSVIMASLLKGTGPQNCLLLLELEFRGFCAVVYFYFNLLYRQLYSVQWHAACYKSEEIFREVGRLYDTLERGRVE